MRSVILEEQVLRQSCALTRHHVIVIPRARKRRSSRAWSSVAFLGQSELILVCYELRSGYQCPTAC